MYRKCANFTALTLQGLVDQYWTNTVTLVFVVCPQHWHMPEPLVGFEEVFPLTLAQKVPAMIGMSCSVKCNFLDQTQAMYQIVSLDSIYYSICHISCCLYYMCPAGWLE